MSTPQELAHNARLILSGALQALQSSPDVPPELEAVAEPIAEAMEILHNVESSGGTKLEGRERALSNVRSALDALQAIEVNHPAVDKATEAVASSLTKLFALVRAAAPAPAAPAAKPAATAAAAPAAKLVPAAAPVSESPKTLKKTAVGGAPPTAALPIIGIGAPPGPARPSRPPASVPRPASPSPAAAVQPAPLPNLEPAPTAAPALGAVSAAVPLSATGPAASPPAAPAPIAAEVEAARRALAEAEARAAEEARRLAEARRIADEKAAEAARAAAEVQRRAQDEAARKARVLEPVPGRGQAPLPAPNAARMNVELGAHSPSNFYKGLAGNDVVEHGGLFIATYKIPKVGTPVALRVLLPGDLEFEADAVVQWVQEARGGDLQPGFGAQLTRISGEGRQLVYRYARNREPMFYDDL